MTWQKFLDWATGGDGTEEDQERADRVARAALYGEPDSNQQLVEEIEMPNPVLQYQLTPAQWDQARAMLAKDGVTLEAQPGPKGADASHEGVHIHYSYDGQTLTAQVMARNMFDPSVETIDQKIAAAVAGITKA